MDALHHSILNIWWEDDFREDLTNDQGTEKRTSFNITSAFAVENDIVQPGPTKTLYENELAYQLSRLDAGKLNQPRFSETNNWHDRLVREGLLSAKPPNTTATVNVIYVHNKQNSITGMTNKTLRDMFAIFGLDNSFLHSLCRATDTWHFIRRDDGTFTFLFIIHGLYCLACSVSLTGRQTNCVLFGIPFEGIASRVDKTDFNFYQPTWFDKEAGKKDAFNANRALPQLLERIKSQHLHHPLSIAYLCLLDSLSSIFVQGSRESQTTSDLEDATEADVMARESLDSWVSLSQEAGQVNVRLARLSKAVGIASLLLETLEDRKGLRRWCQRFVGTADYQIGLQDSASKWLAEGLPSCRQLLENEKIQIRSQEDRVKALTPIIFAHITRADALSMKTIAVMTMAFLPATAIAAIFAVPWERGNHRVQAVQGIVYCVVTVCMTILVFLVWRSGTKWLKWFRNQDPAPRDSVHTLKIRSDALKAITATRSRI